jgi:hypothetical protein
MCKLGKIANNVINILKRIKKVASHCYTEKVGKFSSIESLLDMIYLDNNSLIRIDF